MKTVYEVHVVHLVRPQRPEGRAGLKPRARDKGAHRGQTLIPGDYLPKSTCSYLTLSPFLLSSPIARKGPSAFVTRG
jgi:hypothetical protein